MLGKDTWVIIILYKNKNKKIKITLFDSEIYTILTNKYSIF